MSIQTAASFCILGSVLCLVLRDHARTQAVLLGAAVVVSVLLGALPEVQRIVRAAYGIYIKSGLDPGYFGILCRAVGIGWITQLAVDICKDCGEQAIAGAAELCGRLCLLTLALPLFLQIAETVMGVMG